MTVAVVVHVDNDRPYVDSLHLKLEGVRLIACAVQPKSPIMAFDQNVPLILVWSRHAAAGHAAHAFAAMARAHVGETILCASDETEIPPTLQRLPLSIVNGSPRSSMFPGGLTAALAEAGRRQLNSLAHAGRAAAQMAQKRAFTDGVARGLAGGVAVFGVGGAAALGVEQFNDLNGIVEPAAFAAEATESGAEAFAQAAPEAPAVFADAGEVFVDPSLEHVPLAQPGPEEAARLQAERFVTDTPLETYADRSAATARATADHSSDADIVAALNRVENLRIQGLDAVVSATPMAEPVFSISESSAAPSDIVADEAPTI